MSTTDEGVENPPNRTRDNYTISHYSGGQIALYVIVQIVCFLIGLVLFVCAIFRDVMRAISIVYLMCFGLFIMQACIIFPRIEQALFGCYVTWIGRGLFYVLCGALLVSYSLWDMIFGVVIMIIGILFCFLEIPFFRYIHTPRGVIPAERWF